jgi:FkbM family methyltransferase
MLATASSSNGGDYNRGSEELAVVFGSDGIANELRVQTHAARRDPLNQPVLSSLGGPLARLRVLELRDRAIADAIEVSAAATRRLGDRMLAERVTGLLERHRPSARHRMLPLLEIFAELRPEAFFVQIGSHDGQQQDPLREVILGNNRWRGIMVEPVPYVFERLRHHYGQLPGVALENVAVAAQDGPVPFYHLAPADDAGRPGLPIWFDALGSLRREVVLRHQRFIPDIEQRIVEATVPGLTFASLCRRHEVEAIDLLHSDTEGYDGEILSQLDFERLKPTLIIYESVHLPEPDKRQCVTRLRSFGYQTREYGLDTWCLAPDRLSARERSVLLPVWRWTLDAERRQRPLAATRALRLAWRRARGRETDRAAQLEGWFGLSDAERRYLTLGYDDSRPLPAGAMQTLRPDNPRLRELRELYGSLELPAVQHQMWTPARVAEHVELCYFRGDNLYQWHYPEHPRAMALTLFLYMRYLETRGGAHLLARCAEDGTFGCWTAQVAGYGPISRDLLDSVSEILFLERRLGVLGQVGLRVLDIGAGYGRLAHRMSAVHPSLGDFCCVDAVPESSFLSQYYLAFRGCIPPVRVLTLDRVETLEPGCFDLASNIHSFSECTAAAVQWWVGQLARLRVPYLFVVPNEADGICSREVGGETVDLVPVIAEGGYRSIANETVIDDPAVRELVRIHDRFHLFARPEAGERRQSRTR